MNISINHFGIFAIILLIGAGCSSTTPTASDQMPSDLPSTTASDSSSFTGGLAEALMLGKDMKCTWSSDEGEGITYLSNERVRTEVTENGETSIILGDDTCTYIWQENASEGFQFCYEVDILESSEMEYEYDDTTGDTSTNNPFAADPDPGVDIHCETEKLSDDLFTPPMNITFTNL